jgi:uncharacterized delta-60 repeat protein
MSPFIFRFSIAILILTMVPYLSVYSQQLDTTFVGWNGNDRIIFVDTGFGGFLSKTWGIKGFLRSDNSIVQLVYHGETFGKGTDPIGTMTASFSPDGGGHNWPFIGYYNIHAIDGALQPDGKTVIITNQAGNWLIGRTNAGGSRDTGFGVNGFLNIGFGAGSHDEVRNVAVQADGRIVVSGTSTDANGTVLIVARFNTDGTFDTSFGPNGNGIIYVFDNGVLAGKLVIRPDGEILTAGTYQQGQETVTMLFLLNSNGTPDAGFGEGGVAYSVDFGTVTLADMRVQPDGKVITLSTRSFAPPGTANVDDQEAVLTRINTDGSIDAGFGENSRVIANTSPPTVTGSTFEPSGTETARSLLIENNGNIVMAESSAKVVPTGSGSPWSRKNGAALLSRYSPAGVLLDRNISRRSLQGNIFASFHPIQINNILEQPGKGTLVFATMDPNNQYSSYPPTWHTAAMARFTSISSKNNANNFFDYSYDGKAEFATYRPASSGFSKWVMVRGGSQPVSYDFGLAGDIPVPGDYDGDGIQDLAVFRNDTGDWFTRKIYLNNCGPMECTEQIHFGLPGDVPAPGDFDGDGKTDRAVFRPSEGNWYILFSSGGWTGLHFGQNGDLPVTGDYDDDGKSDVAVVRRENGLMIWYVLQSSNNQFVGLHFGLGTDRAVPADYNGDGKTDIAVFRDGYWYFLTNYTNFSYKIWGLANDIPEPADYDGNGRDDVAVFRPSLGEHYASTENGNLGYPSGAAGDTPIPSAYVR